MDQQAGTAVQNGSEQRSPASADFHARVEAEVETENVPERLRTLLADYDALVSEDERIEFILDLEEPTKTAFKNIVMERKKRKQHEVEELKDQID